MRTRRDRRRPFHRRRGAASLIEVVVLMSVAMVILGISMTTIHLLMRAERHSAQALWHNTSITRLSRVLRDDIHAAREAVVRPDDDVQAAILELGLDDDRQITYSIEEHQLNRVETTVDNRKHRDSFFMPSGSSLQFEQPENLPNMVRLVIQRAPLAGSKPVRVTHATDEKTGRRTLAIQSFIGRDARFSRLNAE